MSGEYRDREHPSLIKEPGWWEQMNKWGDRRRGARSLGDLEGRGMASGCCVPRLLKRLENLSRRVNSLVSYQNWLGCCILNSWKDFQGKSGEIGWEALLINSARDDGGLDQNGTRMW